jgi:predicted DNA-binding transcriptional regulator YafY
LRLLADSGREFSVKELAEQLGSNKSTIQRDLATLESEFALVEEKVGKQKKVYRIDQSIKALESISFGTAELLALHAAHGALTGLSSTPLHGDLSTVIRKIRGFLSPRHNGGLDAIARVFHAHPRGYVDYGEQSETIDDLADAIARRRMCRMLYHAASKGTSKEHLVKPLRLLWHRSALYLLAILDDRSDITTFAVQRIEALEVKDDIFPQPRVNVAEHTQRAFGVFVSDEEEDVEILFDEDIAWKIEERTFHPSECKERLDDGRLRYTLRSSAQWEIIPWVLSFGSGAELVGPASWREALRGDLQEISEKYR